MLRSLAMHTRSSITRRHLLKWSAACAALAAKSPLTEAQGPITQGVATLAATFRGRIVTNGEPGFGELRDSMAWNGQPLHARIPDAIVRPTSVQDVSAAIRFARANKLKVAIRTGGHDYNAASIRTGGLLLDLSQLDAIEIDSAKRVARVQPARKGGDLAVSVARYDLGFPVGHCADVPLGGYLLSGGLGWNSGSWGLACASVYGIEMVTADGEIVYADEHNNNDLFWAARGAGPGFFAVVTRVDLILHELPPTIRMFAAAFPMESVPLAARWLQEVIAQLDSSIEVLAVYGRDPVSGESVLSISAFTFAADSTQAIELLKPFRVRPESLTVLGQALEREIGLLELLQLTGLPRDKRIASDSHWSDTGAREILVALGEIAQSPLTASRLLFASFRRSQPPKIGDSALSVAAAATFGAGAFWDSESDDAEQRAWIRAVMNGLAPHSAGSYVGEADLTSHPDRVRECFTIEAWNRLVALKRRYDPEDLFFSYLTEAV